MIGTSVVAILIPKINVLKFSTLNTKTNTKQGRRSRLPSRAMASRPGLPPIHRVRAVRAAAEEILPARRDGEESGAALLVSVAVQQRGAGGADAVEGRD